jgi:hypothetical protein
VEKKPHSNHSRKLDMQGARRLIFILAASTTLGFWAVFSNKVNLDQSAAAGSKDQASGDTPRVQTGNRLVLDLPPMPTLIPPLDPSTVSLQLPPVASQNSVNLSQPGLPMTGKIFLGGAKPKSGVVVVAPITKTRSSR